MLHHPRDSLTDLKVKAPSIQSQYPAALTLPLPAWADSQPVALPGLQLTRVPPSHADVRHWCNDHADALRVRPVKGDALIFYSNNVAGEADFSAWHGSCAVELLSGGDGPQQTKWVAQKWLRSSLFLPRCQTPRTTTPHTAVVTPQRMWSPFGTDEIVWALRGIRLIVSVWVRFGAASSRRCWPTCRSTRWASQSSPIVVSPLNQSPLNAPSGANMKSFQRI